MPHPPLSASMDVFMMEDAKWAVEVGLDDIRLHPIHGNPLLLDYELDDADKAVWRGKEFFITHKEHYKLNNIRIHLPKVCPQFKNHVLLFRDSEARGM